MKDELGGKIMSDFVTLRPKTYSYLTNIKDESRKAKDTKKCVIKRQHKFKKIQLFLEVTQLKNKINKPEKNKLAVDSQNQIENQSENQKELIKNNELIKKIHQRFRCKKQDVFTEKCNQIALRANDDNRIQSIDSTKTNAYGTGKDLACKERTN